MAKNNCPHLDADCRSQWHYIGDKVDYAAGYCTACGQPFVWNESEKKLVIKDYGKGKQKTKRDPNG